MSARAGFGTVVLAITAGVLVLPPLLPAASQAPAAPVVAAYFAKDATDHYFSDSAPPLHHGNYGDSLLIRGPMYDKASGDKVGSYYISLDTIRHATGLSHARLTVRVPGGRIISEGMFNLRKFPQNPQTLAVVGGTRDYKLARGTVHTVFLDKGTAITFRLFLN